MRYAHTNLIANDWRALADFYVEVFGCVPVSSERDHSGPHFERLTGMPGGRVRGRHLRLPGHGERGPFRRRSIPGRYHGIAAGQPGGRSAPSNRCMLSRPT